MKVIPSSKLVAFDVDNTLLFSVEEHSAALSELNMPVPVTELNGRTWAIHEPHCESIKDFKARGHTVIVWSAGGYAWAQTVIKHLKLDSYVDYILDKPTWFFDDKPASDWLHESQRTYIPFFKNDPNTP